MWRLAARCRAATRHQMRTISAKHPKGQEPPRRIGDDLRLIRYILTTAWEYFVVGYRIRKRWYAKQRAREKYYVDDEP